MEAEVLKKVNSRRYVVEDTFTKVTSDGEPHGALTIVAGVSGMVVACIILAILTFFAVCDKSERKCKHENCPHSRNNSRSNSRSDSGKNSRSSSRQASRTNSESSKSQSSTNSEENKRETPTNSANVASILRKKCSETDETDKSDKTDKTVVKQPETTVACIYDGKMEGSENKAFENTENPQIASSSKKTVRIQVHAPPRDCEMWENIKSNKEKQIEKLESKSRSNDKVAETVIEMERY